MGNVSSPALQEESPVCLASRHSHWLRLYLLLNYLSTFLHPFAPRALPRFFAPTDALTPAQRALRTLTTGNEHPPYPRQVSLVHTARPSMHSVTTHLARPAIASPLPTQHDRLPPGSPPRSGLRLESEGSSLRTAESCSSLSYGLHVRLGLLSTPRCGDAVTFDYPGAGISRRGDFHPSDRACSQARRFRLSPGWRIL
jgi:hypothetical protein